MPSVTSSSTSTQAANSEVSPDGLVAVALIASPAATSGSLKVPNENSACCGQIAETVDRIGLREPTVSSTRPMMPHAARVQTIIAPLGKSSRAESIRPVT